MAIFAQDSFTGTDGTDITSRNDDLGNGWTEHASDTVSAWQIQSNRARNVSSGSSTSTIYNAGTPAGAEYDVEADNYQVNASGVAAHCLVGRLDTGANTWYEAGYTTSGTDRYYIAKRVAGVVTEVGTNTAQAVDGVGVTTAWKFEVRNATKKLFIGGVEKASTTDDTITAAGKAGMRGTHSASSGGPRFDNFKATDAGAGPSSFTLSGSSTAGAATGSGSGLGYRSLSTLAASGTGDVATGSGSGLATSPPAFALAGAATAASAPGSGAGLAATAPTFAVSGAASPQATSGAGAGLTTSQPGVASLGGAGAATGASGSGAGLTYRSVSTGSGMANVGFASGSGLGLSYHSLSQLGGTASATDATSNGPGITGPIATRSLAGAASAEATSGGGALRFAPRPSLDVTVLSVFPRGRPHAL